MDGVINNLNEYGVLSMYVLFRNGGQCKGHIELEEVAHLIFTPFPLHRSSALKLTCFLSRLSARVTVLGREAKSLLKGGGRALHFRSEHGWKQEGREGSVVRECPVLLPCPALARAARASRGRSPRLQGHAVGGTGRMDR